LIYPANEPLVCGIDETIERRWDEKIAARGIYRDPVRSSHSHFVKASGLRWLSLMLLGFALESISFSDMLKRRYQRRLW
jgi:hypothetical protein